MSAALFPVPALLLMAAFLAWPIADAHWRSLFVETPFAKPVFTGLENYARLFSDRAAVATFGFTFLFVAVSVALEVLAGLVIALVLNETFRGRGFLRASVLVPWAIPTVVTAVMWKYMLNDQYGVVNLLFFGTDLGAYRAWLADPVLSRVAVIVADAWKTSPFAALIILAGLQAIPVELHEAARVDGAGPVRRFFSITLPLLRPTLLLATLFRMIDAFRVFDLIYVMTLGGPGGATTVLQLFGYRKMFPEQQLGYGSAVAVVVFLVTGIVALMVMRTIRGRVFEE